VVIIDEGQFYPDLYETLRNELQNTKKRFIVGGLSGDFNMRPIGQMIDLIPLADEIIKLEAYCVYCQNGNKASFTKRIIKDTQTIVIGKGDIYVPVCRQHH
jgi:thymidine kinase